MRRFPAWFVLPLLLVLAGAAGADGLSVSGAWTRATAPGQKVAGLYLDIESSGAARLVGVESPAAESAELHLMTMDGGTMRMRAVDAIDLPAGKTVSLKPGGYHVMLFGLKDALKAGGSVPFTLTVVDSKGGRHTVEMSAQVRNLDGSDPHKHH
jgi:periplasmic copper chaperone A